MVAAREPVPVLMYHRVWPGLRDGLTVMPQDLRTQWAYLREAGCECLTMDRFLSAARGESRISGKTFLLTFDDGYLNNVENAVPLLLKYQIPATFFVSSASLTEADYLHPSDHIDLIANTTSGDININGVAFHRRNKQLVNSNYNAYQYINSLDFKAFKKAVLTLKQQFPSYDLVATIDREVYKMVTPEKANELAASDTPYTEQ